MDINKFRNFSFKIPSKIFFFFRKGSLYMIHVYTSRLEIFMKFFFFSGKINEKKKEILNKIFLPLLFQFCLQSVLIKKYEI